MRGFVWLIIIFFSFPGLSFGAIDFSCGNKSSWLSGADLNLDFYNSKIKPDGSPPHSLTTSEQLSTLYNPGDYAVIAVPDPACQAIINCPGEFSGNWNQPGCTCGQFPQVGCAKSYWEVENQPALKSGGTGTAMPEFPNPSFPSSWNERFVYSHSFAKGTTDANISLNISANIDKNFIPEGGTATIENCGSDSTTIGGAEVTRNYRLVKGLKTKDQGFSNWYTKWPSDGSKFSQDWGVCGKIEQWWTQGPTKNVAKPAVSKAVGIISYVLLSEGAEIEIDRNMCPAGFTVRKLPHPYPYRRTLCESLRPKIGSSCPAGYVKPLVNSGMTKCWKIDFPKGCPSGTTIKPTDPTKCIKKPPPYVPPTPDPPPIPPTPPPDPPIPPDPPGPPPPPDPPVDPPDPPVDPPDPPLPPGPPPPVDPPDPPPGTGGKPVTADEFFKGPPVLQVGKLGSQSFGNSGFYTPSYGGGHFFCQLDSRCLFK